MRPSDSKRQGRPSVCRQCRQSFITSRMNTPGHYCSNGCAALGRNGAPKDALEQYEPDCNSGCWLWTGAVSSYGYGRFCRSGTRHDAHRASYERSFGPILPGAVVRHKCDTPACINPAHLVVGSKADNTHDMLARGRYFKGNRRGGLLSIEQVRAIYAARLTGETASSLASTYGVRPLSIQKIWKGRSWTQITGGGAGC